jgi:hypothetical protein
MIQKEGALVRTVRRLQDQKVISGSSLLVEEILYPPLCKVYSRVPRRCLSGKKLLDALEG